VTYAVGPSDFMLQLIPATATAGVQEFCQLGAAGATGGVCSEALVATAAAGEMTTISVAPSPATLPYTYLPVQVVVGTGTSPTGTGAGTTPTSTGAGATAGTQNGALSGAISSCVFTMLSAAAGMCLLAF
jgi:hypothetical protein